MSSTTSSAEISSWGSWHSDSSSLGFTIGYQCPCGKNSAIGRRTTSIARCGRPQHIRRRIRVAMAAVAARRSHRRQRYWWKRREWTTSFLSSQKQYCSTSSSCANSKKSQLGGRCTPRVEGGVRRPSEARRTPCIYYKELQIMAGAVNQSQLANSLAVTDSMSVAMDEAV